MSRVAPPLAASRPRCCSARCGHRQPRRSNRSTSRSSQRTDYVARRRDRRRRPRARRAPAPGRLVRRRCSSATATASRSTIRRRRARRARRRSRRSPRATACCSPTTRRSTAGYGRRRARSASSSRRIDAPACPAAPTGAAKSQPEFADAHHRPTTAARSTRNLAAMVANPDDLVRGQPAPASTDRSRVDQGDRAPIATSRADRRRRRSKAEQHEGRQLR